MIYLIRRAPIPQVPIFLYTFDVYDVPDGFNGFKDSFVATVVNSAAKFFHLLECLWWNSRTSVWQKTRAFFPCYLQSLAFLHKIILCSGLKNRQKTRVEKLNKNSNPIWEDSNLCQDSLDEKCLSRILSLDWLTGSYLQVRWRTLRKMSSTSVLSSYTVPPSKHVLHIKPLGRHTQ